MYLIERPISYSCRHPVCPLKCCLASRGPLATSLITTWGCIMELVNSIPDPPLAEENNSIFMVIFTSFISTNIYNTFFYYYQIQFFLCAQHFIDSGECSLCFIFLIIHFFSGYLSSFGGPDNNFLKPALCLACLIHSCE